MLAHVAMLFGAARMLKAHEHHLKASIHLGPTPKCSHFAWSPWHAVPIATCHLLVSSYFDNFPNSSFSNNYHSSNSQIISKLPFSNNSSKFLFFKFNFPNFHFQIIFQSSNFQIYFFKDPIFK